MQVMATVALLVSAALFGGMLIYSFGFAPLVFRVLAAGEASRFMRQAFPRYYLFVFGAASLGGLLVLRSDGRSAAMMAAIAVLALAARQILMPRINAARDRREAGDPAGRRAFGRLHGLSVAINLVQLVLAAWVVCRFLPAP